MTPPLSFSTGLSGLMHQPSVTARPDRVDRSGDQSADPRVHQLADIEGLAIAVRNGDDDGMAGESMRALSEDVRCWLARQVMPRVVGPNGQELHQRIFLAEGERWFAEERPIRRVYADPSMLIGGLRALLLQCLHPLVMAGIAQHSRYRDDPWGRVQETGFFLTMTAFGPADEAARAVARVRGVHRRVHGLAPDGRPYFASDPHLLGWVHVAGVDSFLAGYQRYGLGGRLDQDERDGYVEDTAFVASKLGVLSPPRTEAELRQQLRDYRPELAGTAEAREAARYLLFRAPLPLSARLPYSAIAAAALDLMPAWTRWPLRLPYLPAAEATLGRLAGRGVVAGIQWATSRPPADYSERAS